MNIRTENPDVISAQEFNRTLSPNVFLSPGGTIAIISGEKAWVFDPERIDPVIKAEKFWMVDKERLKTNTKTRVAAWIDIMDEKASIGDIRDAALAALDCWCHAERGKDILQEVDEEIKK